MKRNIPSLLSLSYKKVKYINYEYIQTCNNQVEKDIYYKVVEESRRLIKKSIKYNKTQLILKTIYLMKKYGIMEMIDVICKDLYYYDLSLWRISMVHAVSSWISRETNYNKMLEDIIYVSDMVLHPDAKERENVLIKLIELKNSDDRDIYKYIDIYMSMGQKLKP